MSEELPVPKPRAGCVFLALPILLTIVIASLYFLLFLMGSLPGISAGEHVVWTVQTCPAGKDIIEKRVEAIGLGTPIWEAKGSGWTLSAQLPGRDAEVDARIPWVLAQPGHLGVFAGPEAQPAAQILGDEHIASTSFTLRELGSPLIEVRLTKEGLKTLRNHMETHQEGSLSIWLDDTLILERQNTPVLEGNLLELRDHDLDGKIVLTRTAEWSIILGDGPLPCEARLSR